MKLPVPGSPEPAEPYPSARRTPRFYVLEILAVRGDPAVGEPVPVHVSVIPGRDFAEFIEAWRAAGRLRGAFPERCFVAGDLGSTSYWELGSLLPDAS